MLRLSTDSFFNALDEVGRFARGFGGEGVGLELVLARQHAVGDAEDHADRRVEEAEEDESGVERGAVDLEGRVQFRPRG